MTPTAEATPTIPELHPADSTDGADVAARLAGTADVFWLPRRAGRIGKGVSYRRFETLAEAVTFSLETIPGAADVRIYTGQGPISQQEILRLYGVLSAAPDEQTTAIA